MDVISTSTAIVIHVHAHMRSNIRAWRLIKYPTIFQHAAAWKPLRNIDLYLKLICRRPLDLIPMFTELSLSVIGYYYNLS